MDSVDTQWKTEGTQWKVPWEVPLKKSKSNQDFTNRMDFNNVELIPKEYQLAYKSLDPCTTSRII